MTASLLVLVRSPYHGVRRSDNETAA